MARIIYDPASVSIEDGSGEGNENLFLHFTDGINARFHVWIKVAEDGTISLGDQLYKNSIADRYLDRAAYKTNPAHFDTRKLDPNAKENAALLEELLAVVRRDDLVAKAREAKAERLRIAEERSAVRRRIAHVQELGPQFLDVLRGIEDHLSSLRAAKPEGYEEGQRLRAQAKELLALADMPMDDRREFKCRPTSRPDQSAQSVYAVNERAAREDYATRYAAGLDILPEEVEAVEQPNLY